MTWFKQKTLNYFVLLIGSIRVFLRVFIFVRNLWLKDQSMDDTRLWLKLNSRQVQFYKKLPLLCGNLSSCKTIVFLTSTISILSDLFRFIKPLSSNLIIQFRLSSFILYWYCILKKFRTSNSVQLWISKFILSTLKFVYIKLWNLSQYKSMNSFTYFSIFRHYYLYLLQDDCNYFFLMTPCLDLQSVKVTSEVPNMT